MTASGPYTQSNNFTHKFNIIKLCKPKKVNNTIMNLLNNNDNFSLFKKIVDKSGYSNILNNPQTKITLFIPKDDSLKVYNNIEEYIDNMNILLARKIVQFSMLNNKIYAETLASQSMIYLITALPAEKLAISYSCNKIMINHNVTIIEPNIDLCNGLIHITDRLLIPNNLSSASYFSQTF